MNLGTRLTIGALCGTWITPIKANELKTLEELKGRGAYQEAGELGSQILQGNKLPPGVKSKVRRLTAEAFKETQNLAACQLLFKPLPHSEWQNEDLMALGDCTPKLLFPKWALQVLQAKAKSAPTADVAYYYLGSHVYAKGDYTKAQIFFEKISTLPSRLEKERNFKEARIQDISDPSADHNQQQAQTILQIPGRAYTNYSLTEKLKQTLLTTGRLEGGYSGEFGRFVRLTPGSQVAYDTQAESGNQKDIGLTIRRDSKGRSSPYAEAAFQIQYLSYSNEVVNQSKVRNTLSLSGSVTSSTVKNDFYVMEGRESRPSVPLRAPSKGFGLYLDEIFEFLPNPFLLAGAQLTWAQTIPNFTTSSTHILTSVYAAAKSNRFRLVAGYDYLTELTSQRDRSSVGGGIWGDLYLFNLGFVSLSPPPGYRTFRFMRLVPLSSSQVVTATVHEGEFFELNVAPKVYFTESFHTLLWFRYVNGTKRSYVSYTTANRVEALGKSEGNYRAFAPDSSYESRILQLRILGQWFTQWLGPKYPFLLQASASLLNEVNRYTQDRNDGFIYADLLDQGGGSLTTLMASARVEF
jgi:hypothetical protein